VEFAAATAKARLVKERSLATIGAVCLCNLFQRSLRVRVDIVALCAIHKPMRDAPAFL